MRAIASTPRPKVHDAARNGSLPRKHYHCPSDDDRMRSMRIAASFDIEYLQYLGPDGHIVADLPAAAPDADVVLSLFRQMLFLSTFDGMAEAMQRTGKLLSLAPCLGLEATYTVTTVTTRPAA